MLEGVQFMVFSNTAANADIQMLEPAFVSLHALGDAIIPQYANASSDQQDSIAPNPLSVRPWLICTLLASCHADSMTPSQYHAQLTLPALSLVHVAASLMVHDALHTAVSQGTHTFPQCR